MSAVSRGVRRTLAILTAAVVIGAAGVVGTATAASAADPVPPTPAPLLQRDANVVTSDNLPTVQIDNGYVWAQTTVGNTVYAVGSFSNVRPAGAAIGTNLTPRSNILAFDIRTGNLISSFAPSTNGVVRAVTASADGTRLYIGGSFNTVNGQTRYNFAALDASTGALIPGFSPSIGGTGVYAIATAGTSVYVGGLFTQANATARQNLAAFSTTNGALLPWAPTTDRQVDSMVMEPGDAKVIAAGRFYQTNAQVQRGLVALDPSSGAIDTAWLAPKTVVNGWSSGTNAGMTGIFALNTDASGVYGTGWVYATVAEGNLEGVFAANAGDGSIRWIADCHGDHYGVYSTGTTVYATSHTHQCDTVGLAPEMNPRTHKYVEAFTASARGTLPRSPSVGSIYKDWSGTPSPSAYAWYPDFTVGTTSGLGQAGLSITGNGDYISIGGEFGSVNNRLVQGLVRFSTKPSTGAKDGPRLNTANWTTPTARSVSPGTARISIPANWDRDDKDLTYELRRAGVPTPVATKVVSSTWWNLPQVGLLDTGLTPGSTQSYTVSVKDGDGNTVTSQSVDVTIASGTASTYANRVLEDGASLLWRLGGVTQDWAGSSDPVYGSAVSTVTPGALTESGSTASAFAGNGTGTSNNNSNNNSRVSSPLTPASGSFSTEIWFKTSTQKGGKLIGYGSSQTGSSNSYDRHMYMSNDGRIFFGTYPGSVRTVNSTATYRDNAWHHAVGTLGADGMKLYVDGVLVGSDPGVTSAESYNGYWRVGGDNISSWPSAPSSYYFAGSLDEAAVYPSALTPEQIAAHYALGQGLTPPTAAFTATAEDLVASFVSTSTAPSGRTITGYAWNFGDGTTGSGATPTHTYASTGSYDVTLTVTDSSGLTSTVTNPVAVTAANALPTATFTTSVSGLTASVNAGASSDADGSITNYSWNWGDGSTDTTGATSAHRYAAAGTFTVTLTVTDDRGGVSTTTRVVEVTHAGPTANFSAVANGLNVSVDASASAASDGATMTYSWNWGDGTPDTTGLTATHAYATAGARTVTLTVTDSLGASATTSQPVSVSSLTYAGADDFARSVNAGWGAADIGGTWSALYGAASAASVSGGVGQVTLPAGQTRNMALSGVSVRDAQQTVKFSLSAAASTGNSYVGLVSRQSSANDYTIRAYMQSNGAVMLIAKASSVTLTSTSVPGLTWTAGTDYMLKTEVTGASPTTIRAKIWAAGSPEPASWQLSTTDGSAGPQTAGAPNVHFARAGSASSASTVSFDEYRLVNSQGVPVNTAPVAAFSSTVSGLTASVDGSGSSDAEGAIASYSWNWGDSSAAGTGATASHVYAAAGTYQVTLTVTDAGGLTNAITKPVTVTAPAGGPDLSAFAGADDFGRSSASGWGSADKGGTWSALYGAASAASVSGGVGQVTLPAGQTRNMALSGVSVRDAQQTVKFSLSAAASTGNSYVGLVSRQSSANDYTIRAYMQSNGAVMLIAKASSVTLTSTSVPGLTWTAGTDYMLKTEVTGASPTTIRAKIWAAGSPEPASWQLSTTDGSAGPQTAGAPNVHFARAGSASSASTVSFDEYRLVNSQGVPVNTAPVAAFSSTVSGLTASVDGSGSSDAEGAIASYSWNWGDSSAAGTGATASHVYAAAGTYQVTLTVTDAGGLTNAITKPVTVTAPAADNTAPVAAFSSTVSGLTASVDGSGSSDAEGAIASYSWNWGDSSAAGTGATASHVYAAAGTYQVTLTVTDAGGLTNAITKPVTVTAPAGGPDLSAFAGADDFGRSSASGWGSADKGGTWSALYGAASAASVSGGVGQVTLPAGQTRNMALQSLSLQDTTITTDFSLAEGPETGAAYVGVVARQNATDSYQVRVWLRSDGGVWLVTQRGSTVLNTYAVPGVVRGAGDSFTLRAQFVGSGTTTIQAKLWRTGESEPAAWQIVSTDATSGLQAAGSVAVHTNRSGSATSVGTFSFDNVRVAAQ